VTLAVAAGLGLALISTGALNWGFFTQHSAARSLPRLRVRRPLHSLALLYRDRRWITGFAAGLLGWALYVGALFLAPLSLVQAASAGGIGLLALLVSRNDQRGLAGRERFGVAAAVLGLALLAVSLAGGTGRGSAGSSTVVVAWLVVSAAVAGGLAGPAASYLAGGAALGLSSGALYAAGDVGTKAALFGGSRLLLVPAILACHGLAFVAFQLGLQRGGALASAGLATLLTNVLPIVAGTIVFGEGLPAGPLGAVRLVSFAAVVLGAAALGLPERTRERTETRRVQVASRDPATRSAVAAPRLPYEPDSVRSAGFR
jgi:hypothetical protein